MFLILKPTAMKQLITPILVCLSGILLAQPAEVLSLNKPSLSRGKNIMEALASRASATEFTSDELSLQDISDLLWAANGINRPEIGKKTAPSATNSQDIDVYVVTSKGAYIYEPVQHLLKLVNAGDFRELVAGRQKNFANAPLFCIMVSDISRFRGNDDSQKMRWAAMDAAIVSQNINIFCSGVGLRTRTRAFMEADKLREALKLTPSQFPMLNNPVSN
jgi:SagB-type dehydrogenase family enzyme